MFHKTWAIVGGLCLLGGVQGCSAPQVEERPPPPEAASVPSAVTVTVVPEVVTPTLDHGRIRFSVEPEEAEIGVDGVTQGLASDFVTPAYIELEPGPHRIEVRLVGFETYRAEVYVAADVTETIPVKLRRLPAMPKDSDDKDKETAR